MLDLHQDLAVEYDDERVRQSAVSCKHSNSPFVGLFVMAMESGSMCHRKIYTIRLITLLKLTILFVIVIFERQRAKRNNINPS